MYYFECEDVNEAFINVIQRIKSDGSEISKQQTKIKEIYPVAIRIKNPETGILYVKNRSYNPAFMIAETLWNLTAQTEHWLVNYNQKYNTYFTNGKLLAGYGNRIFNWKDEVNQITKLVDLLRKNPLSQHGTIIVTDPSSDLDNPIFVPCITLIKFRIRENRLHMSTFMRAQDMWLGFPYDAHLLLSLFQLVSSLLEIRMGDYYHYCDVARLYERNYIESEEIARFDTTLSRNISMELDANSAFESLERYKYLIVNLPENLMRLADKVPEYWANSIKTCYAYNLIKRGNFELAIDAINSISNVFKDQFFNWSRKYDPTFYRRLIK